MWINFNTSVDEVLHQILWNSNVKPDKIIVEPETLLYGQGKLPFSGHTTLRTISTSQIFWSIVSPCPYPISRVHLDRAFVEKKQMGQPWRISAVPHSHHRTHGSQINTGLLAYRTTSFSPTEKLSQHRDTTQHQHFQQAGPPALL